MKLRVVFGSKRGQLECCIAKVFEDDAALVLHPVSSLSHGCHLAKDDIKYYIQYFYSMAVSDISIRKTDTQNFSLRIINKQAFTWTKKYLEVIRRGEDERIRSLLLPLMHYHHHFHICTWDTSPKTKNVFRFHFISRKYILQNFERENGLFFSWFIIVISLIWHHLLEAQIGEGWHLLTEMSGWIA